jgi:hypothetical protein
MLGGIQLPALVWDLRPWGIGWPGRWRGRGQSRVSEPTPECRLVRQRQLRMLLGQLGANHPGAPARVGAAQDQGGGIERLGMPGTGPTAGGVVRHQPGVPPIAVAPPQSAHGPRREGKLRGHRGQRGTRTMALDDSLSQIDGEGAGHSRVSFRGNPRVRAGGQPYTR